MANSGVLGGGGYQGRYVEFAWQLISQDIASNTSTIYWRVTVVGGINSYYFHHRDYCDAFGEVLVNSTSRTQRYKGDLNNGYKTIQHDVNGYADFSAHIIAAVYTSSVNEDVSTSWALPLIPRQAKITNLPASFNDEEDIWFDFSNPANWTCNAWLEPNPNGAHYAGRVVTGTGGRFTWNLTEAERKQLRQACKGNSCTMRIGLYSNGTTWASYHDRTFIIKDPMLIAGTPTWESTNHLDLANKDTVIKGYSNVAVTVPIATPVKEAAIKQYKVIVGDKIASSSSPGIFNLENINDSIIKVYVEDSRGNTVEKILNITNFINYYPPTFKSLSLERAKGGIGTNVILKFSGSWWRAVFGIVSNSLNVQYFYKEQGSSGDWIQGTTNIYAHQFSGNDFDWEFEIAGDLGANGFNAGKNYDIKLVAADKLANAEKTTILTNGIPNMAIHRNGVAFGSFYDPSVGGPLQVEGRNIANFKYSTEEQWTGDYWIDGKKIYTKTVAVNFNDGSNTIPHGIANFGALIDWQIRWYDTMDKNWRYGNRRDSNDICIVLSAVSTTGIAIKAAGTNWQSRTKDRYVTLYYTKEVKI